MAGMTIAEQLDSPGAVADAIWSLLNYADSELDAGAVAMAFDREAPGWAAALRRIASESPAS